MFDSIQAAQKLNITPRALRRLMRNHHAEATVGSGGRYVFSEDDIEVLREVLNARRPAEPTELAWLDQTPGFTMAQTEDPRLKQQRLEIRRERQRRLDARLQELARDTVTVCS